MGAIVAVGGVVALEVGVIEAVEVGPSTAALLELGVIVTTDGLTGAGVHAIRLRARIRPVVVGRSLCLQPLIQSGSGLLILYRSFAGNTVAGSSDELLCIAADSRFFAGRISKLVAVNNLADSAVYKDGL